MDNLDIRLTHLGGRQVQIVVDRPPLGSSRQAAVQLPRAASEYGVVRLPQAAPEDVRAVGQELFEVFFPEALSELIQLNLARSRERHGLRLRVDVGGSRMLAKLPWESLWNPRESYPYALQRGISLTRFVEVETPSRSLHPAPILRWLFAGASPEEVAPLDLEGESRFIREGLSHLREGYRAELIVQYPVSLRDLESLLSRYSPQIVYLSAHGFAEETGEIGLALVHHEKRQMAQVITPTQLQLLFDDEHASVGVAVLNACMTGAASIDLTYGLAECILSAGVPSVIAMFDSITDKAAQALSEGLANGLAGGDTLDNAVCEGRRMIRQAVSEREWLLPMLFTISSDGQLWQRAASSAAVPEQPQRITHNRVGSGTIVDGVVKELHQTIHNPPSKENKGDDT